MPPLTPQPGPGYDYDSIPVGYYDEVFKRCRGVQSKWHHLKFDVVRRAIPNGARHLDVACGPGTFVGTLSERITSVGVDISQPQIDYARRCFAAPHRHFEVMHAGHLPFDDCSFDVVTCIELIEHISEDEAGRLMQECRRVLRPGGNAIFTTPNYGALWPILEVLVNRIAPVSYQDQHISHYTRDRLRTAFGDAGFSVRSVATCLFVAPFAAALSWKMADFLAQIEQPIIGSRAGHLLVGNATK